MNDWATALSFMVSITTMLAALTMLWLGGRSLTQARRDQERLRALREREALLAYAVDHYDELSAEEFARLGLHAATRPAQ